MKPIGIAANLEKPQVSHVVKDLLRFLKRKRISFLLEDELARERGEKGLLTEELARKSQFIVVLGGDGTVLRVARQVHPCRVPLLPVNLGKLGFLASCSPQNLKEMLLLACKGKARMVEHATLDVDIDGGLGGAKKGMMALNDAVISRGAISRAVQLELRVDGAFLNSYFGDGVIFSTPTGSTAYSLSAGGPIVMPGARVLVVTPICPHTLSGRPVVLGEKSVVETRIMSQTEELYLGLDGQTTLSLKCDDRVRVTIGKHRMRMLVPPDASFLELLRHKLHWTGSHI